MIAIDEKAFAHAVALNAGADRDKLRMIIGWYESARQSNMSNEIPLGGDTGGVDASTRKDEEAAPTAALETSPASPLQAIRDALEEMAKRTCDEIRRGFFSYHAPNCHPCKAQQCLTLLDQLQGERPKQPVFPAMEDIANTIHYPQCWDTAAYPSIYDALYEMAGCCGCSECKPAGKNPDADQQPTPPKLSEAEDQYAHLSEAQKNQIATQELARAFGFSVPPGASIKGIGPLRRTETGSAAALEFDVPCEKDGA